MKPLRKVIWAEGTFLGQQHFQQWERYLEYAMDIRHKALHPYGWGLVEIKYDDAALEHGVFRIHSCCGIFPDRTLLVFDDGHDGALEYDLTQTEGVEVDIYIGMPGNSHVTGVLGYREHRMPAWSADYTTVEDENDAEREREVAFAKPNLYLLSGGDAVNSMTSMQIATLVAEGDGAYRVSDSYIPPVLHISASSLLKLHLHRNVELLEAKIRLVEERLGGSKALSELGHGDVGGFMLDMALRRALQKLRHLTGNSEFHPEIYYRELSTLVEELGAFSQSSLSGKSQIPGYRHDSLAEMFDELNVLLLERIEMSTPSKSVSVKFDRTSDTMYEVDSIDSRIFNKCGFYLAVFSDSEGTSWIEQFGRQAKVSSRKNLNMVVASALPGVRVQHVQRPPSKIPVRAGYEYFRLEPKGDFWDDVVEDMSLALFIPREFVDAKIDLLTVEE